MKKLLFLAFASAFLFSCSKSTGGGEAGKPPEPKTDNSRPAGIVTGKAVDALIIGGTLSVYDWTGGEVGDLLGSATTDQTGGYEISIVSPDTPVYLELVGGYYIEEASGQRVDLSSSQKLRAIAYYVSGKPLSVMVTPWTNIGVGYAQWRIKNDSINAIDAISAYLSAMTAIVGVDVSSTTPFNITDESNVTELTDELIYGFQLAAASSLTKWASEQNNFDAHKQYTSIGLAQIMYSDVSADGVLNGSGFKINASGDFSNEIRAYSFGIIPLNTELYRRGLALEMINVVKSDYNNTSITLDQLFSNAERFSSSTHAIWGNELTKKIDADGPVIDRSDLAIGATISGNYVIPVLVEDQLGVSSIVYSIDGTVLERRTDPEFSQIEINTNTLSDGEHLLEIEATDTLDNVSTKKIEFNVDNSGPTLFVDSENLITNKDVITLTGTVLDPTKGGITVTVNDQAATLLVSNSWTIDLELSEDITKIVVVAKDGFGNTTEQAITVNRDKNSPDLIPFYSQVKTLDPSGSIIVSNLGDVSVPIYYGLSDLFLGDISIEEASLISHDAPYFGIISKDAPGAIFTDQKDLDVEYQVSINNVITKKWSRLSLLKLVDGEGYLIPLTVEYLGESFSNVGVNDFIRLNIKSTDNVGNSTDAEFSFTAHIDFPKLHINTFLNTDVTAYRYVSGNLGGVVGKCTTNEVGYCKISVAGGTQDIKLKVEGGHYIEPSTGFSSASGVVYSYVHFTNEDLKLYITPISSLYAVMVDRAVSIDSGVQIFTDLYGFHPYTTEPFVYDGESTLSEGSKLGLMLEGISEFATNHSGSSTEFTELMAVDYGSDGMLDGVAIIQVDPEALSFKGQPIDANTYRTSIPKVAIERIQSEGGASEDVFKYLQGISLSDSDVYGDQANEGLILDEVSPVISLQIPGLWNKVVTIGFGLDDFSSITGSEVFIDDGSIKTFSDTESVSFDVDSTLLIDGDHTISVSATDRYDNSSTVSATFTVDNTQPDLNVISSKYSSEVLYSLTGTVEDKSKLFLSVNGVDVNVVDNAWSTDMELEIGDNQFAVEALDEASNSALINFVVYMDNEDPVLSITSKDLVNTPSYLLSGMVIDGSPVTLTINDEDVLVSGGSWSALYDLKLGENSFTVKVTDQTGNTATADFSVYMDDKAPILTITSLASVNVSSYALTGTIDDFSSVTLKVNGVDIPIIDGKFSDNMVLAIGSTEINIEAIDHAGNKAFVTHAVYMDNKAPILSVNSAQMVKSQTYSLTGTVIDDSTVTVEVNGEPVVVTNGSWSVQKTLSLGDNIFTITAVDQVDNSSELSYSVYMDNKTPIVSVTSPDLVNKQSYILTGTISDDSSVTLRINGALANVSSGSWSKEYTLDIGNRTFNVEVVDVAGNTTVESFTVFNDHIAPELEITSSALSNIGTYTLRGQARDDSTLSVSVNGEAVVVSGGQWSKDFDLSFGESTFTVIAVDQAGNTTDRKLAVYTDTQAPEVTITSRQIVNKVDYLLTGTVSDQSTVTVTVDGLPVDVDGSNWSIEKRASSVGPAFNIVAEDLTGNKTVATFKVLFDELAPLTDIFPSGGTYWSDNRPLKVTSIVSNTSSPLYIHESLISLGDTAWTQTAIENAGYMYLNIRLEDQNTPGATPFDELKFQTRYLQDGAVIRDWQDWDKPVKILPFVTEVLAEGWDKMPEATVHTIEIRAGDIAGNWGYDKFVFKAHIARDFVAPELTVDGTFTKFSKGDGVGGNCVAGELDATNSKATPLCFDVTKSSLNGKAVTQSLSNDGYMSVKINVQDPFAEGQFSQPEDVIVEYQYLKNDDLIVDWSSAPRQPEHTIVYLPLVTEYLGDEFFITSKEDIHTINFRAIDEEGNIGQRSFELRLDVLAPEIRTNGFATKNEDIFGVAFDRRVSLNGADAEIAYLLENSSNAPLLVNLDITPKSHSVNHSWESAQRYNEARVVDNVEWRVKTCVNCSRWGETMHERPIQWSDSWTTVHELFSSDGKRFTPYDDSVIREFASIASNTLAIPSATAWADDVPEGLCDSDTTPSGKLHNNLSTRWACPARTINQDNDDLDVEREIQARTVYSVQYKEGYPINQYTTTTMSTFFDNDVIRVFNLKTNSEILPVNGWYAVPANTAFEVVNSVELPVIDNKTDDRQGSDVPYNSKSHWDKSIAYLLNTEIVINRSINPESNNPVSVSSQAVGSGSISYTLNR